MILLAEIVDFQRFPHPRELMAYLGLVPSEYSSGEAQRRGAITKAGNTHARRALVEAAWHYRTRPASGVRCAAAPRTSRPPLSLMPGERSSVSIGVIAISSDMANGHRWLLWPWRASSWASSGRR